MLLRILLTMTLDAFCLLPAQCGTSDHCLLLGQLSRASPNIKDSLPPERRGKNEDKIRSTVLGGTFKNYSDPEILMFIFQIAFKSR